MFETGDVVILYDALKPQNLVTVEYMENLFPNFDFYFGRAKNAQE